MLNKVKHFRRLKKLTQSELAEIVGISRPYLSDIERNECKPTITIACKIAKSLNVKMEEIFFELDVNQDLHENIS